MPSVTIPGSINVITDRTDQTAAFTYALNLLIGAGIQSGGLIPLNYIGGPTAPSAGEGRIAAVNISSAFAQSGPIAIPLTGGAVIIGAPPNQPEMPVSITGGGAGIIVEAGSGGLSYTDITPSGSATDYIVAGDGNNTISTSAEGTGNYSVNTGGGNDDISINGNSVINAGGGRNTISFTTGNNYVYSEGYDMINGSTVVGGAAPTRSTLVPARRRSIRAAATSSCMAPPPQHSIR